MFAGRLKPGDKLPSVRDFAYTFQVNPNTVQKALNELETEELIFTERTNGKYVTKNQKLIDEARNIYARKLTKEYQNKMKAIGYQISKEEND